MKLKGAEKKFWWDFGQIKDSNKIPAELPGFTSIDSLTGDEDLAMLIDKVKIIKSIYLKETEVTDEGVKSISEIQQLKSLTLMKHPKITKKSLPYLNKLTDLEYLDIWRTEILLEDIHHLNQLKNLKELYVSSVKYEYSDYSEMDRDHILEEIIKLEEILPNCIFYVDHNLYQ